MITKMKHPDSTPGTRPIEVEADRVELMRNNGWVEAGESAKPAKKAAARRAAKKAADKPPTVTAPDTPTV